MVKWYLTVFLVPVLLNTNDVDMFDIIQFLFNLCWNCTFICSWYLFLFQISPIFVMPLSTPTFHFLEINISLFSNSNTPLIACLDVSGPFVFLHLGNACLCTYVHFSIDLKKFFIYFRHVLLVCLKNIFPRSSFTFLLN